MGASGVNEQTAHSLCKCLPLIVMSHKPLKLDATVANYLNSNKKQLFGNGRLKIHLISFLFLLINIITLVNPRLRTNG